jgi:hypothetical protein
MMGNLPNSLNWLKSPISDYIPLESPKLLFNQFAVILSLDDQVAVVMFPIKLLESATRNIRQIEAGFKGYFKCQVNVRLVGY